MQKKMEQGVLYTLFFISGIVGLIYQVIWVRMFGLVFGNTIFASSTVLASFMAGLGAGSYFAGKYIKEKNNGIKLYSCMELLIGLFGIFMPAFVNILSMAYSSIYNTFDPTFKTITVIRFTLSFVVMVIPCTFMGATLPILCKFITDNNKGQKNVIGKLYGINTIGAVAGCMLSGFLFVGRLGLIKTSVISAILNLAVSCAAYFFYRNPKPVKDILKGSKRLKHENNILWNGSNSNKLKCKKIGKTKKSTIEKILIFTYCLSGFASIALEVSWTKAMVWITSMDSYAYASMLSVILAGIGIGSLLYSLFSKKIKNEDKWLYTIQFLIGITVIFSITAIQKAVGIKQLIENILNNLSFLKFLWNIVSPITMSQLMISTSMMLIPSILMGISFPLFANLYIKYTGNVGEGVGDIYSANTFGGILGSLLTGFIILPSIGLLPAIAVMGGLFFINALLIFVSFSSGNKKKQIFKASITLVLAFSMIFITDLDFKDYLKTTLDKNAKLLYFKENSTGSVMVENSEQYGNEMLIDGVQVASDGDFDLHSHIYPAHLMSLLKKDIKDILVVAFGCGGTSGSILKYNDVNKLDVVEISDGVIAPAKEYFTKMNSNVFSDPRLNLIIQDGKNYVHMTDKKYDIIYSGPIHPQSNQGSAALYTKDYFSDCKSKLKSDGFQCLWLPMHMSSSEDFKIIVKTFMEVYPYVTMWVLPQTDTSVAHPHLIGSMVPIYPDYQVINEKMKNPTVIDDLKRLNETSFTQPYEFISQFAMGEESLKKFVGGIKDINTDDLPIVEFYKHPKDYLLSTATSKAMLLEDTVKYMENPYQYVQNVPDNERVELKKQLDRLYEGNKALIMGHYFLTAKQIVRTNVDSYVNEYYTKAFKLLPDSTYLKNYFK